MGSFKREREENSLLFVRLDFLFVGFLIDGFDRLSILIILIVFLVSSIKFRVIDLLSTCGNDLTSVFFLKND